MREPLLSLPLLAQSLLGRCKLDSVALETALVVEPAELLAESSLPLSSARLGRWARNQGY